MVHVTASNYSLNGGHLNWLLLFFNQIVRYGTPFFAVISGFLLYNQVINRNFNVKKFIFSRFTKIIIPFIIWSLIYLIIKSGNMYDVFTPENSKLFLYNFVLGKSHYHLYFIAVVLQFYFLFIFLRNFNSKKSLLYLTIISFFLNYFNILYPIHIESVWLNKFFSERAFILNWIFYFFFGGLLVHYWTVITKFVKDNIKYIIFIGIIPLIFIVIEYNIKDVILDSTRVANLFYTPILFVSFTCGYFLLENSPKIKNMFIEIGNLSMGIYLVHPLVIYYLRQYIPWIYERTRWILFGYILTVLISLIIVKLIHKTPIGHYIVTVASPKKRKKYRYNYREEEQTN